MIKILHLADLHLNANFNNKRESVRALLKEELLSSFEQSVEYAIDNSVDLVLIVGDFLDHPAIGFKLQKRLECQINKLIEAKIHVAYVTGNHDPLTAMKWVKSLENSAWFHFIGESSPASISLKTVEGTAFRLVACGHAQRGEFRNLVRDFPVKEDHEIWIGAAHASVDSYKVDDPYMPTKTSDIESLNYNYFALGHIHQRDFITPKIAYSGSIQGMNITETGRKGGILVQLDEVGTIAEPVDFSKVEWKIENILITGTPIEEVEDLLAYLIQKLEELIGESKEFVIVRLNLKGKTGVFDELSNFEACRYIEEELIERLGILDLELNLSHLEPDYDYEILKAEKTVVSELLFNIENWEEIPELKRQLTKLPIFKRSMTEDERVEHINNLIGDARIESMNWMVRKTDENK